MCGAKGAMNDKLKTIRDKYSTCPEFFTVVINDVNQRGNSGDTLLHVAGRQAVEDIELLVELGAQLDAVGDLGNTALHQAASRGLVHSVKKLIELGAHSDIKNEFGQTPLNLAKLMERTEVIRLLTKRQR
jgi:ankyrin repeat protein